MRNRVLLGFRRWMIPIPAWLWKRQVAALSQESRAGLTPVQHRIRDFVVQEMHRVEEPLSPEVIAQRLTLPLAEVRSTLDLLELGMVYLYRMDRVHVDWAYPVTADETPHHLQYSSGEQGYAA